MTVRQKFFNHFAFQQWLAAVCVITAMALYVAGNWQWHRLFDAHLSHQASVSVSRTRAAPQPLNYISDYKLPPAQDGLAPVISRVPTTQPVVFLTIDDGVVRYPDAANLLQAGHIPASLFLVRDIVRSVSPYFAQLSLQSGSVVEDHTLDHPDLSRLTFNQQKQEICADADYVASTFGRRPNLMRPPYGSFNTNTRRAAAACGMKAVVLWHAKVNGGAIQYQDGNHLVPGDIVLMHFRVTFQQDLQAFIGATRAAGLHPQLLEQWLGQ